MKGIIIADCSPSFSAKLRALLTSAGFPVREECKSGAQVLSCTAFTDEGLVICRKLPDMSPARLDELLPGNFSLLVLLPSGQPEIHGTGSIVCLHLPVNRGMLLETVQSLWSTSSASFSGESASSRESGEERQIIDAAKKKLMEKNYLSESRAYRMMRQMSMNSGRRISDIAKKILDG